MSRSVTIILGQVMDLSFHFEWGNSAIEGYAMLTDSTPATGRISLNLDLPDSSRISTMVQLDQQGHYQFEALPAGAGRLMVQSESGAYESVTILLRDGETIHVDFLSN